MPPGAKPWCGESRGCRIAPFGPSGAEVHCTTVLKNYLSKLPHASRCENLVRGVQRVPHSTLWT